MTYFDKAPRRTTPIDAAAHRTVPFDAAGRRIMPRPSLLVSVRNLAEARAAIDGGCDRLDVKEPLRGPLGMADAGVIAEVAAFSIQAAAPRGPVPCSVALGEMDDSERLTRPFVLPSGVSDIKLGPARVGTLPCWVKGWRRSLEQFRTEEPRSVRRVAVAYADWQAAGAPPPDQILSGAIEVGADAFLIDTCRKDVGSLFEAIDLQVLGRIADASRRAGIPLALAGSLRLEQLAVLVELCPDVIAVRGAACGGTRSATVSSACVRQLKSAICELF